ncbi:hypothetical protein SISSUDRAFT_1066409 [Sistotremastrum suecicum HHB10207 ss-3]|uniref:peptidylprolyl isomerase n=1 Tax=Sistotremastrum suecicum HHB10207 ss-3 TaxID=1314776 RepID=A0A165YCL1_9AGAM|nr:hypothetical protein SISSUDRAFT_1066409 [Sistotremastrum suecicum HHB10207 ss-3]
MIPAESLAFRIRADQPHWIVSPLDAHLFLHIHSASLCDFHPGRNIVRAAIRMASGELAKEQLVLAILKADQVEHLNLTHTLSAVNGQIGFMVEGPCTVSISATWTTYRAEVHQYFTISESEEAAQAIKPGSTDINDQPSDNASSRPDTADTSSIRATEAQSTTRVDSQLAVPEPSPANLSTTAPSDATPQNSLDLSQTIRPAETQKRRREGSTEPVDEQEEPSAAKRSRKALSAPQGVQEEDAHIVDAGPAVINPTIKDMPKPAVPSQPLPETTPQTKYAVATVPPTLPDVVRPVASVREIGYEGELEGIAYRIVRAGDPNVGPPRDGQWVKLSIRLSVSGVKFPPQKRVFKLHEEPLPVAKGVDKLTSLMLKGEEVKATVPRDLTAGEQDVKNVAIPANVPFVYQFVLQEISDEEIKKDVSKARKSKSDISSAMTPDRNPPKKSNKSGSGHGRKSL